MNPPTVTGTSTLVLGFLLGLRHATEPDHLVAVATLATRHGTLPEALRQGLAWGLGHTLTLLLIGSIVLVLEQALPPHFEQVLELGVCLMLVLLGVDVLRRTFIERPHFHAHRHAPGEPAHLHEHSHRQSLAGDGSASFAAMQFRPLAARPHEALPHVHRHPPLLPLRALLVGMMHGMAGSAALIALSIGAAESLAAGLLYILLFGIGAMAGMAVLSTLIAVPLRLSAGSMLRLHRLLTIAIGLLSVSLGVLTAIMIGRQLF
nr:hypothetical protein [Nevskia ramosa]